MVYKAANQGGAEAQFNLGAMYYSGEGVYQNMATAKEWFGKSRDNGYQNGCNEYRILNKNKLLPVRIDAYLLV